MHNIIVDIDYYTDNNIDELVNLLELASDYYYNSGDPILEDSIYDILEKHLRTLDPYNTYFMKVGSETRGEKVKLPIPMGSLDQLYTNDASKWIKDKKLENEIFVISDKQDGISGLIRYIGGKLLIAYSRGNGIEGSDITRHVLKINSVPKVLSENIDLDVRVEIIIAPADFNILNSVSTRKYKNPRNYTAGKMNTIETDEGFSKYAKVIVTSVISPDINKQDQFELCKELGFLVTPYDIKIGKEINDDYLITRLKSQKETSETEIDGLVIDVNDITIRNNLTRKSSSLNPTYSKKFKILSHDNAVETTVISVVYEASKNGYLKPRVKLYPVDIGGVTISYATGFNAKFIKDNNIGPNAKIKISRAGDVIPFIQEVVSPSPFGSQLPTEHEFGKMKWSDNNVDMMLIDPLSNKTVILNKMHDAFSKLEIPSLKKGNITKLVDAGMVDVIEVIKADKQKLQSIVGNSAGEKIFDGLKERLNPVPMYILAAASQTFGRGIGIQKIKKLTDNLGNDMSLYTKDDILKTEGFDEITTNIIIESIPKFYKFLEDLDGYYVIQEQSSSKQSDDFEGMVFVFTGCRNEKLEKSLVDNGGKIGSGVSTRTTYLICNDVNASSGKIKKAKELEVKIIDINEAMDRWLR